MTKKTAKKQPKKSGASKKAKPDKRAEQLAPAKGPVARTARSEAAKGPANKATTADVNGTAKPADSANPSKAKTPARPAPRSNAGDHSSPDRNPASDRPASDRIVEAAQPLQTFAVDMQRMAKQSIEQTSEVLERLREARNVEEVVSLQTTFMQQSFRRYTEFASRISELMAASQASLFQQSQAAMRNFRSMATGASHRSPD